MTKFETAVFLARQAGAAAAALPPAEHAGARLALSQRVRGLYRLGAPQAAKTGWRALAEFDAAREAATVGNPVVTELLNTRRLTERHIYGIRQLDRREPIARDLLRQLEGRGIAARTGETYYRTEWLRSRVRGSTLHYGRLTDAAHEHFAAMLNAE